MVNSYRPTHAAHNSVGLYTVSKKTAPIGLLWGNFLRTILESLQFHYFNNASLKDNAHHACERETVRLQYLFSPDLWLPNSPVDYKIGKYVCKTAVHVISYLKQCLSQ